MMLVSQCFEHSKWGLTLGRAKFQRKIGTRMKPPAIINDEVLNRAKFKLDFKLEQKSNIRKCVEQNSSVINLIPAKVKHNIVCWAKHRRDILGPAKVQ